MCKIKINSIEAESFKTPMKQNDRRLRLDRLARGACSLSDGEPLDY